MRKIKTVIASISTTLLSLPVSVLAVGAVPPSTTTGGKFENPEAIYSTFQGWFSLIYGIILSLAVIYFVWGGIKYLTSGGDPEKAGTAKTQVAHGAAGIAVVIGVAFVIKFIANLIGVNIPLIPFIS